MSTSRINGKLNFGCACHKEFGVIVLLMLFDFGVHFREAWGTFIKDTLKVVTCFASV